MSSASEGSHAETERVILDYRLAALRKLAQDPLRQVLRIAKRRAREFAASHHNQIRDGSQRNGRVEVPGILQPPSLKYAGFSGPWFEEHFLRNYQPSPCGGAIYLPILWDNFFAHAQGHTYLPVEFATRFRAIWSLLRNLSGRNQAYFTIQGIYDFPIWNWHHFPTNIVVLAGNGYGDKAIPLLKGDRPLLQKDKTIDVSFMGRTETDPIRATCRTELGAVAKFGFGRNWEEITAQSHFSLCPRGVGPTSFRLFEALSLTSIPIYIWQRWRWLPYEDELDWSEFSLIIEASQIPSLASQIQTIAQSQRAQMQARIAAVYQPYFSYDGITRWITQRMTSIETADDARKLTAARSGFRF